jgi:hypothetical protein
VSVSYDGAFPEAVSVVEIEGRELRIALERA